MGGGASIPLPEYMGKAEAMVLAGRGKFSEAKWLKVARDNLPLGEEPTATTLISRRQFLVRFLEESSSDEEEYDGAEAPIMAGIGMPNDDGGGGGEETLLTQNAVREMLAAEDWSQRVATQFDALVDAYGCITPAQYVERILPTVCKQRTANRDRVKAERARQAALENLMASRLQAAARGYLNRKVCLRLRLRLRLRVTCVRAHMCVVVTLVAAVSAVMEITHHLGSYELQLVAAQHEIVEPTKRYFAEEIIVRQ